MYTKSVVFIELASAVPHAADIRAVAIRWRLTAANPDPDTDPATPNYETFADLDGDGVITVRDVISAAAQ